MKNIAILGSTGPTGRILTQRLCEAGYTVTVVHRSESAQAEFEAWGASVVRGDAFKRDDYIEVMGQLADSCDMLVSLLGGNPFNEPDTWPDYTGNVNAIDGAVKFGLKRFILVTSVGTGRSWQYVPDNAYIRPILELKSKAEEHLKETELDWTIVKPGGLGPPGYEIQSGDPLITENHGVHGLIDRSDLADVILRVMFDNTTIRKELYTVVDRVECCAGEPDRYPLAPLSLELTGSA